VLLRAAHDMFDLPISVFRCSAILGDGSVGGHVHLSDPFTRLILSLSATRVAPSSFYELDAVGKPQQAHHSGLPVGFVARAITTLALQNSKDSFVTYHVTNPHADAISLDTFVDWLVDDGVELTRIQRYDDWFQRFETALQRLSARQRQVSLLPMLSEYRKPGLPLTGPNVASRRFQSALSALGIDGEIPHITPEMVHIYVAELRRQRLF
jgi:fatty acid CoA ligase FadD9